MKIDVDDLKDLAEDLETIQSDYADALRAEPLIQKPLEDLIRTAKKRYSDISERLARA